MTSIDMCIAWVGGLPEVGQRGARGLAPAGGARREGVVWKHFKQAMVAAGEEL